MKLKLYIILPCWLLMHCISNSLAQLPDTAQLADDSKTDGVWLLEGKNYHCMFSKTYTVTFTASISSGNSIEGYFQQSGGALEGTFVLNKK